MDTAGGGGTRRFVVLNDAPVGDGAEDDLLEVDQVARGLADLIVASRATAPFTLAVDGAWGMGKSSLLHRLEATLSAEPAVSAVWFNAWTSGRASALEGLIKSVLLRFDRNVLRRALRSMSQRAHLLGVVRGAALALASFFGAGRVVDEMWQRMSLDAQARNEIKGVLRDAFGAWLAKGGEAGDRRLLVVFVDDLDRCASERIVEVCEAIKLYLDVPGIVFVLACDQSALWRAVRESAGIGEPAAAVEYLEKIVQISYRIPAPVGGTGDAPGGRLPGALAHQRAVRRVAEGRDHRAVGPEPAADQAADQQLRAGVPPQPVVGRGRPGEPGEGDPAPALLPRLLPPAREPAPRRPDQRVPGLPAVPRGGEAG